MRARVTLLLCGLSACAETQGSKWMAAPLGDVDFPAMPGPRAPGPPAPALSVAPSSSARPLAPMSAAEPPSRRVGGTFRNTYYDFPREIDHKGARTPVFDAECKEIARVPRGFHDAVCVQGSGRLARGATISFAKRDCACAEVCPRSGQKICFEALDPATFPHGRGATGKAITPMRTVAVDSTVLPLGTVVFLPELEGAPTSEDGSGSHDGCFVAEDRGIRVKGEHLDIFTGSEAMTRLMNRLVPSNQGVTVVTGDSKCGARTPP